MLAVAGCPLPYFVLFPNTSERLLSFLPLPALVPYMGSALIPFFACSLLSSSFPLWTVFKWAVHVFERCFSIVTEMKVWQSRALGFVLGLTVTVPLRRVIITPHLRFSIYKTEKVITTSQITWPTNWDNRIKLLNRNRLNHTSY